MMDRWIDFQKKGFLLEERSCRGQREISRNDWPGTAPRTPARRGPVYAPGSVSSACPRPIPAYVPPALAERAACLPSMVQQTALWAALSPSASWGPENLPVSLSDVPSERLEFPGCWQTVFLALWSGQMERASPSGPPVLCRSFRSAGAWSAAASVRPVPWVLGGPAWGQEHPASPGRGPPGSLGLEVPGADPSPSAGPAAP